MTNKDLPAKLRGITDLQKRSRRTTIISTTLNKIREHNPCQDGWKKLLNHLGKTAADDEPLNLLTILDSNGLDDCLWCLRAVDGHYRDKRLYSVWCARQVQHLMTDERSLRALDVAEAYAKGNATDAEMAAEMDAAMSAAMDAAMDAARDAAWAAEMDAAWAAARAAARDVARAAAWDAAMDAAGAYTRGATRAAARAAARGEQTQLLRLWLESGDIDAAFIEQATASVDDSEVCELLEMARQDCLCGEVLESRPCRFCILAEKVSTAYRQAIARADTAESKVEHNRMSWSSVLSRVLPDGHDHESDTQAVINKVASLRKQLAAANERADAAEAKLKRMEKDNEKT